MAESTTTTLLGILKINSTAAKTYIANKLSKKQDKLTFDTTPTANSSNPVTSSGIKAAIEAKTVDLSGYAQLASPALTGTPTAPTASAGTNTTQIATTAFVATAISNAITKIEDGDSKSY